MVNSVHLVGYMGKAPEIRYTSSGTAVANFSLATTHSYKKNDEKIQETEWHKVIMFGRTAEVCGEYLKKGSLVFIAGRLKTREWEDKEGIKRHVTEIIGETLTMLGGKDTSGSESHSDDKKPAGGKQDQPPKKSGNPFEDDLPF